MRYAFLLSQDEDEDVVLFMVTFDDYVFILFYGI